MNKQTSTTKKKNLATKFFINSLLGKSLTKIVRKNLLNLFLAILVSDFHSRLFIKNFVAKFFFSC